MGGQALEALYFAGWDSAAGLQMTVVEGGRLLVADL